MSRATVAAMLAWQGFHVAVLLVMGIYVCAQLDASATGRCTRLDGQHGAAVALRHGAGVGGDDRHLSDTAFLTHDLCLYPNEYMDNLLLKI